MSDLFKNTLLPGEALTLFHMKCEDKLEELKEKRWICKHGGMSKQEFCRRDNDYLLYLRYDNEESIMKVKEFLGCRRFYIVFDSWAEEMYYVFEY